MEDKKFLEWLRDRLHFQYGENLNVDYMLKLQVIIDNTEEDIITPSAGGADFNFPECLLEEGLELARGAVVFGVSIDDMSKDQLKALAALGWKDFDQATVQRTKDLV